MKIRFTRSQIEIARALFGIVMLLSLDAGCTLRSLKHQKEFIASEGCTIEGTVRTEWDSPHPIIVVLARMENEPEVVDHYVLEKPGRFRFRVLSGKYALGAFVDENANGIYEREPAATIDGSPVYDLLPGERTDVIELVISPDKRASVEGPINIAEMQARSIREQERRTLGQLTHRGDVVDLHDSRFSPENGNLGLWDRVKFMFDVGAGIYFLEECNPSRTPILFIHGMKGYPREFETLVTNLDRKRFEPWFYYYPSGANLPLVVNHLTQLVKQLRLSCPYNELYVVAHSMGGLVARSFIQEHHARTSRKTITLFVSISTPWRGVKSARSMVNNSGMIRDVLPPAFQGVAWDSPFINTMFFEDHNTVTLRRRLPDHVAYYLIFGHKRNEFSIGASDDRVVSTASATRLEVVHEAQMVYPLDNDHTEILKNPETTRILQKILGEVE